MNPKQLEQLLLLEQSGELSPAQRRALAAELAATPKARRFRDQLCALSGAVPPPAAQPASDAAARIAARLAPQQPRMLVWKPLLATAAALVLLLGVYTFRPGPTSAPVATAAGTAATEDEDWSDPLDAEFTELESLLAAISTDDAFEITEL